MKLKHLFIGVAMVCSFASFANPDSTTTALTESVIEADDPALRALDELVSMHNIEAMGFGFDSTIISELGYAKDSIPQFSEAVIAERLAFLDENTPFELQYNKKVKAFINLYAVRKKGLTEQVLGLSEYYFPMFETILDQYNLPLEFKYLAVVESALNPTARSRAGATGLWQFMYATGKIYDLKVTSYEDLRMDPVLATHAACKYFTFLNSIYHDWNLVLAAYNFGPGNVNKAIRRSGYKRDYWQIYPYLPRETRGYVPAFIAVNYIMSYPNEHNMIPDKPNYTFFDYDTLVVTRRLNFEQIAGALDITMEQLRFLNPVYKKDLIPLNGKQNILKLPKQQVGLFVLNEEVIFDYNKPLTQKDSDGREYVWEEREIYHLVKSGQYLGYIASKYGVSTRNIMEWNNMRSTTIHPGKQLTIYKSVKEYIAKAPSQPSNNQATKTVKEDMIETPSEVARKVYYQIQDGDTLWDIAKAQGVSLNKLKSLNSNLNHNKLKPGSKIVIASEG